MAQFAIDEVLTTGIQISGFIFDYSSSLGTPGQVLASTSSGVMWQADSSIVDLSSLSGQIAATGSLLNNRINSLSGYSDATFATITNLATTGSTLDTKINTLSGYSNANFATILNLAATGSTLDTKINTLSGYSNQTFLSGVGVSNYVPRWSGTKQLVTGNIYDDGTNVGIGTTIPGALLDVNGLFRFQQDIRVNNGTNKLILSATSTTTELHSAGVIGTIFKGAGNNEIARFDAANFNVGIGTATVSRKLHVYVDTGPVMRLQSSGSNASIEFIPSTIQNRYNWLIGAQQNISDAFEITPSTATNGTTFSNPAILVKSDGKVGIGNVSPTTLLSVGGAGSTSAASGITFGADSQANLYRISSSRIKTDGNFTIDGQGGGATSLVLNRSSTSSENGMAFATAGSVDWYYYVDNGNNNLQIQRAGENDTTPRVRFDGSNSNILFNLGGGNVGIGVTNPSEKLTITGAVKILTRDGANFKVGDGSNNNTFFEFDYPDISTADAHFRLFRNTNTNGGKYFQIFKGDGAATSQTLLNANGDSHINAVAGNLGIGTDSPTQKLQVSGTVKIQSLGVYSDPTDNAAFLNYDTNGGIFTLSARSDGGNTYMAFRTSNGGTGSEKVRITNDGRVGISSNAPTDFLDLSGAGKNIVFAYASYGEALNSAASIIGNNVKASPTGNSLVRRFANATDQGNFIRLIYNKGVTFHTNITSVLNTDIPEDTNERMRINLSGNVIIGNTTAYAGLTISDVAANDGNDSLAFFYRGTAGAHESLIRFYDFRGQNNASIGNNLQDDGVGTQKADLVFKTARNSSPIERMRITNAGSLLIGDTTQTYGPTTLGYMFGVKSQVYQSFISIAKSGQTLDSGGIVLGLDTTTAYLWARENIPISFGTNNNEKFRISADGNLGIGTVSPTTLLSVGGAGSTSAASGLTFGGDASANLYRISSSRIKTDGSLEAAVGIISPTITSLSGNIAATGSTLDTKINTLSGYSNSSFATITNLAATGSTLDTKINTLSGYSNNSFATIVNLAATGSTLDAKINTLSGYSNANFATILNLAATGSTLNARINSLSGYAGSTFLSGQGVANWTARWNGAKELITGSIYDLGTGVGIGTTSPAYLLDVRGTTVETVAQFRGLNDTNIIIGGNDVGRVGEQYISYQNADTAGAAWMVGMDDGEDFRFAYGLAGEIDDAKTKVKIGQDGKVGIGLTSPQKQLDVISSENDFVTVGARTLSIGGWAGVHFGYREDNNSYRKSAIVFERTDRTSSNAQGKVHILNGPQAGGGNATLADAKITIDESGNIGIGTTVPTGRLHIVGSDDKDNGPIIRLAGSTINQFEGGRIRFNESVGTYYQGAYIHYDASNNIFNLGVHGNIDSLTSSDVNAISILRSNAYVGIGTTNPIYNLDVVGPATSNGVTLRLNDVASVADSRHILLTRASAQASIGVAGSQTNDPLWISRSSGYDLMIDLNGRVGLGIVNPATLLGIGGAGSATAASGITFGADAQANLYRSAEDTIRTDGALIAGSYLRALSYVQFLTNLYPDSYGDNVNINIGNTAGNSWETAIKIKPGSYVGIGTTQPSGKLHIVSNVAGETVLRADGTNGTLFTIVDDLSDSLMSVNNSAGLPVLEVFADDRIVAGQYGSGDFVLINNKVGIGTTNPTYKLHVLGNVLISGDLTNPTIIGLSGALNITGSTLDTKINTTNTNLAATGSTLDTKINTLSGYSNANFATILNLAATGSTLDTKINTLSGYSNANFATITNLAATGSTLNTKINTLSGYSNQTFLSGVGVANYVPRWSGTKLLVTGNIYDDGTNVGIGTASPDAKLHVRGSQVYLYNDLNTNNTYFYTRNSSAGNAGIKMKNSDGEWTIIANDRLRFIDDDAGGVERLSILSNGNVGIGTVSPTTLLSVGPVGSTLPASGLTFGGDAEANLYRSAEDTIKTDGNLVVAGTTSLNGHIYGKKTVTLTTASYTTVLTVNLTAHTSCYVKIGAFGDWGSHSAVAFVSELFIQNGDNGGYAEPGTIITAHDNTAGTAGDKIDIQIVDPAAPGTQNFLIQLKLISATLSTNSSIITYHVMGQQASVT